MSSPIFSLFIIWKAGKGKGERERAYVANTSINFAINLLLLLDFLIFLLDKNYEQSQQ
jgi:hypothetical protein